MEVQDYLDSIVDDDQRSVISDGFKRALECINLQRTMHNVEIKPLLRVVDDGKLDCYASENFCSITIHSGLIQHFYKARYAPIEIVDSNAVLIDVPFILPTLCMCWALLHEWAHIYNMHDSTKMAITKAKSSFDYRNAKFRGALTLSVEQFTKGTEYDADLNAAASLYRYVERVVGVANEEMVQRKITFYVIFFGLRGLRKPNSSDSHPDFFQRFLHIALKLADISLPQIYDIHSELAIDRSNSYMRGLVSLFIILEEFYLDRVDVHLEVEAFWDDFERHNFHGGESVGWWQCISPWVQKVTRRKVDNNNSLFAQRQRKIDISAAMDNRSRNQAKCSKDPNVKTRRKSQRKARSRSK